MTGLAFYTGSPPAALAVARRTSRSSSATGSSPDPARCGPRPAGGRWTLAGSPNCRCTADGSPPPRTTPPQSPGTPSGSAAWTSSRRRTGCASRPIDGPDRLVGPRAPGTHRGQLPGAAAHRPGSAVHPGRAGLASWPDYLDCVRLYASAGIDLAALPRVGLGSVCRRQSTAEIAVIVAALARRGLRLHGFGVKTGGLHLYGHQLASADSMAWSYTARRALPCPAAPGTATAPTAWRMPPHGAGRCWPATPPAATKAACSMVRTGRAAGSVSRDRPGHFPARAAGHPGARRARRRYRLPRPASRRRTRRHVRRAEPGHRAAVPPRAGRPLRRLHRGRRVRPLQKQNLRNLRRSQPGSGVPDARAGSETFPARTTTGGTHARRCRRVPCRAA